MKGTFFLIVILCMIGFSAFAQQRVEPKLMNYLASPKPNIIIYNDTIYKGSKQFKQLFYRTGNRDLIYFYQKHQSNKIAGQVIGLAGTLVTIFGVSRLSSSRTDKETGWVLLGGGFAATLTGGYLTFMGQRNLDMAVTLFNRQYHKASLGIGVSDNRAGLVYKF